MKTHKLSQKLSHQNKNPNSITNQKQQNLSIAQQKDKHHQCNQKSIPQTQSPSKKTSSIVKQLRTCLYLPILLLLIYFSAEMTLYSIYYLSIDIYTAFSNFFTRMKQILQQNTMFLLFWSVIIIKTKIPQLQRLFYHTIVKSILSDQDVQCSICLLDQCDYIVGKCQHTYHAVCLEKWVRNNPYCPYCRMKVQNKLVRRVPWRRFFEAIGKNKLKWVLVLVVCVFVQYRFYYYDFLPISFRQKD